MKQKRKLIQTAAFGVPEYEMKAVETYRPRISLEHMGRFRKLKWKNGKPITELLAEALDYYFENCLDGNEGRG
jgi:hypothetical protein